LRSIPARRHPRRSRRHPHNMLKKSLIDPAALKRDAPGSG
jgi:hypothetical protein